MFSSCRNSSELFSLGLKPRCSRQWCWEKEADFRTRRLVLSAGIIKVGLSAPPPCDREAVRLGESAGESSRSVRVGGAAAQVEASRGNPPPCRKTREGGERRSALSALPGRRETAAERHDGTNHLQSAAAPPAAHLNLHTGILTGHPLRSG